MSELDEQIDEILDTVLWVGNRWGASNVEGSNVPLLDEPPIQHTKQAKQAIKALIAQQVKEAVDLEKSLRAKTGTERYKDGIQDGLQMALYGTKDGSKEEKFIRHLLYSENIGDDK